MTTYPGTDWPIPCPSEGDEETCKACWASHADATPYCTSSTYKEMSPGPVQDGKPQPCETTPPFTPSFLDVRRVWL